MGPSLQVLYVGWCGLRGHEKRPNGPLRAPYLNARAASNSVLSEKDFLAGYLLELARWSGLSYRDVVLAYLGSLSVQDHQALHLSLLEPKKEDK